MPATPPDSAPAPLRYVALVGPTAAGKTAAAMAIAREYAVEIISVDSALVYRGMDIGTAKPTPLERAAVPHHLIDIRDPMRPYSAAEFAVDARRLISDINSRGKLPLLVGGTMLYFKALLHGLDAMPAADPVIRASLEAQAQLVGWPALHAELARVDPVTAARLAPNDSQRIQRALEVYHASGQPLSFFYTTNKIAETQYSIRARSIISLEPQDRSWLHERIAQRFDTMLATGFLDEVRTLRGRGDLSAESPAMRCVGYRQAWQWLDANGVQGAASPSPISELRDKGIFATRQLAKRQLTWLRSMPERRVVACDDPTAVQQVLVLVQAFQDSQA